MSLLYDRLLEKSRESQPAFLQANTWQGKGMDQSEALKISARIKQNGFYPAMKTLIREVVCRD